MDNLPDAYCFFREIEPQPPMRLRSDREYLLHAMTGALDIRIGDNRWLLPPSFAAWAPADTEIHVAIRRRVTACSILCIPGFCEGFPDHPVAFQMSPLTRAMAAHCRDWGPGAAASPAAMTFFKALMHSCADLVGRSIDVVRPTACDIGLQRAIDCMEARCHQPLDAQQVARACGLSERTMQRRFAAELGVSWRETLTRMRMIRAIELLAASDAKIIEIAIECGFSSLSAFNRAFRKFAGMSPTAFRADLE